MKQLSGAEAALVTLLNQWLRCPHCQETTWFTPTRFGDLEAQEQAELTMLQLYPVSEYRLACTACSGITVTVHRDRGIAFAGAQCRVWPSL